MAFATNDISDEPAATGDIALRRGGSDGAARLDCYRSNWGLTRSEMKLGMEIERNNVQRAGPLHLLYGFSNSLIELVFTAY